MTVVLSYLKAIWPIVIPALPFLASLIARCSWSSDAKTWLVVVLSVIVGAGGVFVSGFVLSPESIGAFALAVLLGVKTAYTIFRQFALTSKWLDELLAFGS